MKVDLLKMTQEVLFGQTENLDEKKCDKKKATKKVEEKKDEEQKAEAGDTTNTPQS